MPPAATPPDISPAATAPLSPTKASAATRPELPTPSVEPATVPTPAAPSGGTSTIPPQLAPSPHVQDRTRAAPMAWWLPWVAGAAMVLLVLMSFGAWQALRDDDGDPGDALEQEAGDAADDRGGERSIAALPPGTSDMDLDCSDGRCACPEGERCSFTCAGDCRVECPDDNCEVTCQHPSGRAEKATPAYRCRGDWACGQACDEATRKRAERERKEAEKRTKEAEKRAKDKRDKKDKKDKKRGKKGHGKRGDEWEKWGDRWDD